MKLADFLAQPISRSEFIAQPTIIPACDVVMASPYFSEGNREHFGIRALSDCVETLPSRPAVVMSRFRDGELQTLLEQCRERPQWTYVIVQTLIGDDGRVGEGDLATLPANVFRIYSKNVRIEHPRLVPMPIGRDWRATDEKCNDHFSRTSGTPYRNLAYMNFSVSTNEAVRGRVHALYSGESWVTARTPEAYRVYELNHCDFVREMHDHAFVFSPVGKAVDCYRTWDALFAKSIPIVDRSHHLEELGAIPVLAIDDWGDLSADYLIETLETMLGQDFDVAPLTAAFWHHRIRADAAEIGVPRRP